MATEARFFAARLGRLGAVRRLSRHPASRRSAWVVVDQGLISVSHFAVTLIIARTVDRVAFGAFGVAFFLYVLALAVSRAAVATPLMIRFSAAAGTTDDAEDARRAESGAAIGAALTLGVLLGGGVAVAGLAAGSELGRVLLVVGLLLPGLVLQDMWRFVFFTAAVPKQAIVNHAAMLAMQVALIGAAVMAAPTVVTLTAAWGVSAIVPAVMGALQARVRPAVTSGLAYLRRHRDLSVRFTIEIVFVTGFSYVTILLLGLMIGTVSVGSIRGVQTLFGPFNTLLFGMAAAAVPEGARLFARRPDRLLTALRWMNTALVVASVAWGSALFVLPDRVGTALLGDSWAGASALIVPMMLTTVGMAIGSGGFAGLRVLEAARESLRVRMVAAAVAMTAGLAGGALAGVEGGVWGLAFGAWINGLGAWWVLKQLRPSVRPSSEEGEPTSLRDAGVGR